MKITFITIIFLAMSTNWCFAQNRVPKEVRDIIDNYFNDSTADCGCSFAKKYLHVDFSGNNCHLKIGRPIEVYQIRYDVLDTCKPNIPVIDLIEASNRWFFPVFGNSRCLYEIELLKVDGIWKIVGCGECPNNNMWQIVMNALEKMGDPILILDSKYRYLHFPQKGANNLFYLRPINWEDSLSTITSNSIESLDSSDKIIGFRKNILNSQRVYREHFFKKNPKLFDNDKKKGGTK